MMRKTLGAILVAVLAMGLLAATLWRAVFAPLAVPPVSIAEASAIQRVSAAEMPACVLGHAGRDIQETRPECQRCDGSQRPTRADVASGKPGECADITGGTLTVNPGAAGVNLRCARLDDVTITADGPLNGLDLSYATLRGVTLKGDSFNAVMTCADVRLGAWEGAFSSPALGGAYLYNVDLSATQLTNIRAAHAMIAPSAWPKDTAGSGADRRISFQVAREASTLLPKHAKLTKGDGVALLTPSQSVKPLDEMARRVDAEAKRQIEARIKALQAGRTERMRRLFASSLWHGLTTIGGVWGLLTMVFFGLIFSQANRSPEHMAIARRGTGAVPWVSPPRQFTGRVTTAGLAALKGLWAPAVQGLRRVAPGAPPPPETQAILDGLRLKGAAAVGGWFGTLAALAVLALMGSKAVFGP